MTALPPVKPGRSNSREWPRSIVFAAALFVAAAALSACGGGSSATHGDSSLSPGAAESLGFSVDFGDRPACASVWVVGKKLPIDYNGCLDGDKWVNDALGSCNVEGPADVATYDDRLWGRLGQPVHVSVTPEVWDDPGYIQAMGCR